MSLSDSDFTAFLSAADGDSHEFRPWRPIAGQPSPPPVDEFARGFDEGQRVAEAAFDLDRKALQRLVATAQALQPVEPQAIRCLILETVERLVSEIVGRSPVDRAWLIGQIDQVMRVAGEVEDARILWLNPADMALLADAAIPAELRADPAVMRGSIRLERESGWIEHGRMTMLDALRGAIIEGAGGQ